MEQELFNAKHKYAALNHTSIFIGAFIVLPLLFLIGGVFSAVTEGISSPSTAFSTGGGVFIALCGIIWFRPLLAVTFQRVYLTDYGIEVRLFSKTVASIQWRDCKTVFPCYLGTTGDLYNHYWTCFSTTQADTTKFSNLGSRGLMVIPKQTNECIYMNRSEFSYAFIKKNVSDAVWKAYVRNLEREKKQYTNEDILDASNDYTVRQSPTMTMLGVLFITVFGIVPIARMLQIGGVSSLNVLLMIIGLPWGILLMIRWRAAWFVLKDDGFIFKTAFKKSEFYTYDQAALSAKCSARVVVLKASDRRLLLELSLAGHRELVHRILSAHGLSS